MTISPDKTRIKIGTGDDLLGIIPYLLGFHPEESVVCLVFESGQLELAARFDLPQMVSPWWVQNSLTPVLARLTTPTVVLVGYGADAELVHDALHSVEGCLDPATLIDSVVVSRGRWWSRMCFDDCCPAEGTPVNEASAAAAAAVVAGCTALSSRRDVEASVAGPDPWLQRHLTNRFAKRVEVWREAPVAERSAEALRLIERGLTTRELSQKACMDLAILTRDIEVRDALWLRMTRADAERHVKVWRQVVQLAFDDYATPPLCLLAAAAWLNGNGALMVCCLSRAHRLTPDYSMLHLLDQIQRHAAPPSLWDDLGDAFLQ